MRALLFGYFWPDLNNQDIRLLLCVWIYSVQIYIWKRWESIRWMSIFIMYILVYYITCSFKQKFERIQCQTRVTSKNVRSVGGTKRRQSIGLLAWLQMQDPTQAKWSQDTCNTRSPFGSFYHGRLHWSPRIVQRLESRDYSCHRSFYQVCFKLILCLFRFDQLPLAHPSLLLKQTSQARGNNQEWSW